MRRPRIAVLLISLCLLIGLAVAQTPRGTAGGRGNSGDKPSKGPKQPKGQTPPLTAYSGISDRVSRPKPTLPSIGPANMSFLDPTYGSRILRVTDAQTETGSTLSFHTTSAADHNTWSRNGQYFYIQTSGGATIPFSFDRTNFSAVRLPSTANSPGNGGRQIKLGSEPDFSFERDAIMLGVDGRAGNNLHTIAEYNVITDTYTTIIDLGTLGFPLTENAPAGEGPYVGYTSISYRRADAPAHGEKMCVLFGGQQQDYHYLVAVFDLDNPAATLKILDTRHVKTGTAFANMTAIPGGSDTFGTGIDLHGAEISRDGRYVLMTRATRTAPSGTSVVTVWDTESGSFTKQTLNVDGHISLGLGYAINQSGDSDPMNWRVRPLSDVNNSGTLVKLVNPELPGGTPSYAADWAIGDHTSWSNATPAIPFPPILSANYRYNSTFPAYDLVNRPWRAWDDEILLIRTDQVESKVWRFGHHRSIVAPDEGGGAFYFWYTPRAQISRDGRYAIFTSNWEKTLGTPSNPEFGGAFRTDVFLIELAVTDTTAPVISSVSATPSDTSALITWTTDDGSDSKVFYDTVSRPGDTDGSLYASSTALNTTHVVSHSATATGLSASTTYYYKVKSTNSFGLSSFSSEQSFSTTSGLSDFATDAFTEASDLTLASHTPDLGTSWVDHPAAAYSSTVTVNGATDRAYGLGTAAYYISAAPNGANQIVRGDIHAISIIAVNAGLAARMDTTADTMYIARLVDGTSWQVRRIVTGSATTLGTSTSELPSVGQSKAMVFTVTGTGASVNLKLTVAGVEVINVNDTDGSRITATGKVGVRFAGAMTSSTGFHLDNFSAR